MTQIQTKTVAFDGDPAGVARVLLAGQPMVEGGALERMLRAHNLDVRSARTAKDALAMVQGFAPDVVIVHWHGLDVAGPKFLRMILDGKQVRPPFIIGNSSAIDRSPEARTEALLNGADAFIHSGIKIDEMSAVLAVAERQKRRDSAARDRTRRILGRLSELQERFDSLDKDLSEAKKLQQGLMRNRHVTLGAASLSLILRSSGHVGGDLVGQFPINRDCFGFYALDVSGHGVSSALMTARLAGYLSSTNLRQNLALERCGGGFVPRAPSAAVADMNQLVMEDLDTDHYFTMVLGYMEHESGTVTLAQAGHPHPTRQLASGRVEFIQVGGLPVGLIPGADYEDTEITLEDGDRLMILSDGFTEAALPDGTFLGESGLIRLLDASRDQSGPALLETLVWDLSEAMGEAGFQDDLSGVLLERVPSPKT
ncbi:MAG: fused response regulator/phosphatase [Pseudomonadota bacterium]